jgi:hypothetical protein
MIRFKILNCFFWMILLFPFNAWAQDKLQPKIDLNYFQIQNEAPYLIARVRTKEGKKFNPVEGAIVSIQLNEMQVGSVTTNKKGEGKFIFPGAVARILDSLSTYPFVAKLKSDSKYEEAEEEYTIHKARLILDVEESKDSKIIRSAVEKFTGQEWVAASGVEVKFFVQRQFGKLPIGEETYTSDESGNVEMEFAKHIPGDIAGKITVGCMIEDNDEFGNLIAKKQMPWGIPLLAQENHFTKRTMWGTRDKTPVWLLVFPNLIILGVWGVVVYLILQIIKLVKIGKAIDS